MAKLAVGYPTNSGNLRISATLPKTLFRRLRTRAAKEGKTVSETIAMSVTLLELGSTITALSAVMATLAGVMVSVAPVSPPSMKLP